MQLSRIIIVFMVLMVLTCSLRGNPAKIALIVAVGDYPAESGWRKINSENDVSIIKLALVNQGFAKENIVSLINEDATKAGILKAFDELFLRAGKGDVVYFHFSGHGQQILDDNGDEVDGLDESIVPYDAGMKYELCPAKGANHIRDDLLGTLLDRIRQKIGTEGDLIVLLDACHSGTATRGIGVSRGTDLIFGPPGQKPFSTSNYQLKQSFYEPGNAVNLSPIVILSGSSATEQNYEFVVDNVRYGSLSYAFSRVLNQVGSGTTYRSVFSKVQVMMSSMVPRQNPQLEGNPDRKLFAGNAVEQKNFMNVRYWRDSKSIVLDAGQLNGLGNSTIVELHQPGTIDPSKSSPIVRGVVVNVQIAEALVLLDLETEKEAAEKSWVFIKEYSYGKNELSIKISRSLPKSFQSTIQKRFQQSGSILLDSENPELFLELKQEPEPTLLIVTRTSHILFSKSIAKYDYEKLADEILHQIKLYVQGKLLRSLEATNERIRLSFEIIPVRMDRNFVEISRSSIQSKTNQFGQIIFNEGDYFKIKITNHGSRMAYYSILDIQPDNIVNVLVPEKDKNGNPFRAPSDCKITPGSTEELKAIFYIGKPYGQEIFKLISSTRPLNLDQIIQVRGQTSENDYLSPIELLFADSFDMVSREGNFRLPPETIHIHTVVFEVAGRK